MKITNDGVDMMLIDFPGFNDSRAELISIGNELAIKSLIRIYNPKVLLIESITNTNGRFCNIANLAK